MRPLHSSFVRLRRCPCCQSRYSKRRAGFNKNAGKTAARHRAKLELRKMLRE